ncbi:MAG TPA: FHA domain-containing protein, partial [Bryobacteraceae bacterium]
QPATSAPSTQPASQVDQIRQKLQQVPTLWWMIGGGVLGVLVLGLILFIVLRKKKPKAPPQGSGYQPPPQQQQQQFGQQPPQYQQAPPQQQYGSTMPQYPQSAPWEQQQAPPPTYQQQPPPYQQQAPPTFQESPLATGAFGQAGGRMGSTFMPLPPEPQPPPAPVAPAPAAPAQAPQPIPIPAAEPILSRASEPRFQSPAKGSPSAWLVCVEGPAAGRSYPIDEAQFWIGANANNHLQLAEDQTVSGNHACIAFEQGTLGIYDHHSTNGLFLNDDRLTEGRKLLKPGDRVRVGRSTFVLQPASTHYPT